MARVEIRSQHHFRYASPQMIMRYQTIIIVSQLTITLAQRADFEPPANQLNRRFSWSTTAPLTKAINELAPEAIPHVGLLSLHMARVEGAVLDSLKRDRLVPDEIVQPCNPRIDRKYRTSIPRSFALQGFFEPAFNCGSDVSGPQVEKGEVPGYTLDDLYNAVFERGATIKKRVNEIAVRLIDNFTRPEVPFNFTYSTTSAKCVLSPACMFRDGLHWHQSIGIHSHGRGYHLADGTRNSIFEFFRDVDGRLGDNLLLRLPKYDNGSVERVMVENTTSMIQTWSGTPNPSCFRLIPIEDNPAVLEALGAVDHPAQQAEDAVARSNLAILLLPLGLNLVPIALFAEVDTRGMLLYTLLSDVLTVIPLAIKGVELVTIRSTRFRSVVTRVLSPGFRNVTRPLAAGGEIWGAECRVREEVGRTGVILILVSAAFFCIGVGGEFLARWYVSRAGRQGKAGESLTGSSGEIGECSFKDKLEASYSEEDAFAIDERYSMEYSE